MNTLKKIIILTFSFVMFLSIADLEPLIDKFMVQNDLYVNEPKSEHVVTFMSKYLNYQSKIQQETREFNLLSNIMKTKHEAAKCSLNNTR